MNRTRHEEIDEESSYKGFRINNSKLIDKLSKQLELERTTKGKEQNGALSRYHRALAWRELLFKE